MNYVHNSDLYNSIKNLSSPVLGICIGMQILCSSSQEGDVKCLNVFDVPVKKLSDTYKLPHMGWNRVYNLNTPLFNGVKEGEWFYFVHSYAPIKSEITIASTNYGLEFSAALGKRNFFGTQFHPEKSGGAGLKVLSNFLMM
jgi:glutamine amidotransferase